jgi:putative sigma-54 modulation protein
MVEHQKHHQGGKSMNVSVTFMNLKSSNHLKDYVHEKLNRFDKLLDEPGSAGVVLKSKKLRKTAEINLTSGRLEVHAKEEHEDMHAAIDLVLDKVRTQITKAKEKLQNRRTRVNSRTIRASESSEEAAAASESIEEEAAASQA